MGVSALLNEGWFWAGEGAVLGGGSVICGTLLTGGVFVVRFGVGWDPEWVVGCWD